MKTQIREKKVKKRPVSQKPAHRKMPSMGKHSGPRRLFSLRNKIFVSFLLPILFVVVIGIVSYNAAADGLSEKFKDSSLQVSQMAMDYVDVSLAFIRERLCNIW